MQGIETLNEIASPPQIRTLKVEAEGDFRRNRLKSKIRLTGYWLTHAGFKPDSRVQVKCVAPGVIELRSLNAVAENVAMENSNGPRNGPS